MIGHLDVTQQDRAHIALEDDHFLPKKNPPIPNPKKMDSDNVFKVFSQMAFHRPLDFARN
jgi:hypothetical protein